LHAWAGLAGVLLLWNVKRGVYAAGSGTPW